MLTRPPLNGRPPRATRDAARDPYDWIEGPQAGDAREPTAAELLVVALALVFAVLCLSGVC